MAPSSPLRTGYLILYNAVSAAAWSVVLYRTIATVLGLGYEHTFHEVGEWTQWTQTAAALEVLHALLGVVRAPVFTTIMQVSSRLLLVWGVVQPYPFIALSPFYSSMLTAWSITEVIRYSFFATTLAGVNVAPLFFLRYNTFFILYPVGITSECALIWFTSQIAPDAIRFALWAILAVYVPGSYVLYTYMMKQRSKVMRQGAAPAKKTQ